MRLAALDLETTGLNPQTDQILQIAVVAFDPDDPTVPVNELPYFYTDVRHARYEGDAYALQMNAWLLKRIAARGEEVPTVLDALFKLKSWMQTIEWGSKSSPHPVGFNVAAFDVAFIKANGFGDLFHYRPVELGSLLSTHGFPTTSNRAVRDILRRDVKHDALQDARDAVELHRHWMVMR